MHFSQSVAIIQSQVGIIKGVQVLYNDSVSLFFIFVLYCCFDEGFIFQNPLQVDLVINLPQDGIRLYFDPVVQRLKIIEIFNMKLVKLKYW